MIRLGITGGIGSGKTTVCHVFELFGVPIYNADSRAKHLVQNQPELKKAIISEFGEQSYINNEYNRAFIGSIVFNDIEKLQKLNAIIHPYVFNDWEQFCIKNKDEPIIIKEAAIMLETESKNTVDQIIVVVSPIQLRIKRLIKRDHSSEEEIINKINKQMSDEDKIKLAHFVIYNDEQHSIIEQVNKIYNYLISSDTSKNSSIN